MSLRCLAELQDHLFVGKVLFIDSHEDHNDIQYIFLIILQDHLLEKTLLYVNS